METQLTSSTHNKNVLRPHKNKTDVYDVYLMDSAELCITPTMRPRYCPFNDHTRRKRAISLVLMQSSSTSLFKVHNLALDTLKLMMLNPTRVGSRRCDLVEVSGDGYLRATNLPDLSDLALQPRAMKAFYTWLVTSANLDNIYDRIKVLSNLTSPCIPRDREMFNMTHGEHRLTLNSFGSSMKVVKFDEVSTRFISIKCKCAEITHDWRDGRRYDLVFQLVTDNEVGQKRKRERRGSIVIWNCRGLGTNGFEEAFNNIRNISFDSDILILTKVRVSRFLCEAVLQRNSYSSLNVFPTVGITGGIAVIGFLKLARVVNECGPKFPGDEAQVQIVIP